MISHPDPCPGCGAETGEGEDWKRVIVSYEANSNGSQTELGSVGDIPETLFAVVCLECSYLLAVHFEHSLEGEPSRSDAFRIDEELR